MATIDTVYYVPTLLGLSTTFGISCGITFCCVLGFEICRHLPSMQCLFNPRSRLEVNAAPILPKSPFSWLSHSYWLEEDYYVNKVGLDATMHLRFLKMAVQFLLLQCLIVCPVLMTLHWSGGTSESWQQNQHVDWNPFENATDSNDVLPSDQFHSNSTLYLLSIANVPNKQPIVWVHVFLLYFISLTWLWLLFVNHWHHLYLLQTCPCTTLSSTTTTTTTTTTMTTTNKGFNTRSQPKNHHSLVKIATAITNANSMNNVHGDCRGDDFYSLPSSSSSSQQSIASHTQADTVEEGTTTAIPSSSTAPSSSSFISLASTSIHQRSILITNIPHPLRNTEALQHHFNVTQVGTVTSVTLVYRAATHALECALKQRQQWVDQLERRLIVLGRQINKRQRKMEHTTSKDIEWLNVPKNLQRYGLPMDDLLTWMHDIRLLDNEIKQLRDVNLSPQYYKPTGTAFVTFESAHSAQICAQAVTCWKPGVFDTTLAPEPRDIMWSTLLRLGRKDKLVGRLRQWIVFCAVWCLTIFWLFPISFILGLTSIQSLSQHFGFLSYFLNTSLIVRSFIQNILPTLLVTLFMSLLPWILLEISKQQDFISYSELEDCVLGRYYHFAIFNVLIVFLLGTSFLSSMLDVLYEPAKIIQLLANSLPQGANFFLNYILFNSATHGMELIQLGSQLFGHLIITLPVFSKTPRILARFTAPWSFPYYYYYPNHILILVITVTYSVIQPLILIFALFYFSVALVVYRHQYAFCYIRKFESGGSRHYRRMTRYTSDGLLIFQLTMVGLLYLKGVLTAATAILPLIVFTIWMKVKLTRLFGQRAKYPLVGQLSSPATTTDNADNAKATTFKRQTRLPTEIITLKPTSLKSISLVSRVLFYFGSWIDDVWKFSYLRSWWKHGRYATQKEQKNWAFMTLTQKHRAPDDTVTLQPPPSITKQHIRGEQEKHLFVAVNMESNGDDIGKTDLHNKPTIIQQQQKTQHPQDSSWIPEWDKHYQNDGCSLYNDYAHPSIMTPLDGQLFLPKDPTLRKWKLSQCILIPLVDLQCAFDEMVESGDPSV